MNQGCTIWLTGLSGAGKTTIARRLEGILKERGCKVEVLDGDVVRTNLSKGLGFSKEDRDTHIRRVAFVSKLLTRNGVVVIAAAISPYREVREEARREISRFLEVYVKCSLEELMHRDVKGLYQKALRGEIPSFTGVSDPYEEPLSPEVVVETDREAEEESTAKILAKLEALGYIPSSPRAVAPVSRDGHPYRLPNVGAKGAQEGETILPHGGALVNRFLPPEAQQEAEERAKSLKKLALNPREISDLEMIGVGAFSPLEGFMVREDYLAVVDHMRLAGGLVWPIPVTLSATAEEAAKLKEGEDIALVDREGLPLAILHLEEKYPYHKEQEAQKVYRTSDEAHPGVRALYQQGEILLGGKVSLIRRPKFTHFPPYRLDPAQTRRLFGELGWRTVVGFQTRNPVHRAHEYIQKCALEIVDGLLLHPLVGETKEDDIPADVRMRCYQALLDGYYPKDRVVLAVLPAAMRYAGPREAIFHAIIRKNYGCTHFIVGRDHAGVGNYYGTYDAHRIFEEFPPGELGITPLFFDHTFFCRKCGDMASAKTCPHNGEYHVTLSGTKVREMLGAGAVLPEEFTRPEVAQILMEAYRGAESSAVKG